jgi:copper resistance protein B
MFFSGNSHAGMEDDPLLAMVNIEQLEVREAEGDDPLILKAEGWIGKDLNKLWIKTEDEFRKGKTEEAEVQLLYSRAVAPFWDFQAGWRHNSQPKPNRDWLALGFKGVAPYQFELDTALFLGGNGRTALRLDGEYEILFTQRLVLTPEVEMNFYGKDDPALDIGSGLSKTSVGLRLRYEIQREFAPYIGVHWWKKYGGTKDFAVAAGNKTDDVQLVAGIRAWF